jgi:2,3-bisphosphoglycerate-independent phosphoglycerate mutase
LNSRQTTDGEIPPHMKVLFLFIDGLGLAPPSEDNLVNPENCPVLCDLIERHSVPIDACLGVPGLPQSASGQTTLFTGVNASRAVGRHVEGFPGPSLKRIVETDNLFLQLERRQMRCRFANAYLANSTEEIAARRFQSVTTTMALTRPGTISLHSDLLANNAVCQDITRESLLDRGHTGAPVEPAAAASHLIQLALAYDLTLFEYFQTDRAGHSGDPARATDVLRLLDAFLGTLVPKSKAHGMLFVLTSDHGNIENMATRTHTFHPVPLIAIGPGSERLLKEAKSLLDITPLLVELLTGRPMS